MNFAIFVRVFWKEYRTLRSFWISLAVLAVVVQLLCFGTMGQNDRPVPIFACALLAMALFALAGGATAFATEHEDGTIGFLRALPGRVWPIFWGKTALSVFGAVLLCVVLLAFAAFLTRGKYPEVGVHLDMWATVGVGAFEFLAWGTLVSLLIKRPLVAAVVAVVLASVAIQVVFVFFGEYSLSTYASIFPIRLGVAAVVMLSSVVVASGWLSPSCRSRLLGVITRPARRATFSGSSWRSLGRLTWQMSRQWWPTVLVVGTPALLLSYFALDTPAAVEAAPIILVYFITGVAIASATVFQSDRHRCGFRFYAEHGIGPRAVWWSRQLVGVLVIVPVAVVTLIVFLILAGEANARNWQRDPIASSLAAVATPVLVVIVAYCAGQFCSMIFRRGLLAGFFALVLTAMLVAWVGLMAVCGLHWIWSVTPLAAALLLATWLRAPGWICERSNWRAWTPVAVCLVVPTVLVCTAVVFVRVYEIPAVDPGFSIAHYCRPLSDDDRRNKELYEQAWAEMLRTNVAAGLRPSEENDDDADANVDTAKRDLDAPLNESQLDVVKHNQKALGLLREAASRADGQLHRPETLTGGYVRDIGIPTFYHAAQLLFLSGHKLESDGKLDEAATDYLTVLRMASHLRDHGPWSRQLSASELERRAFERLILWAGREGQSSSSIERVRQELADLDASRPAMVDAFKQDYLFFDPICDTELTSATVAQVGEGGVRRLFLISRLAPWEPRRARRLLNYATHRHIEQFDEFQALLDAGHQFYELGLDDIADLRLNGWLRSTFALPYWHRHDLLGHDSVSHANAWLADDVMWRRATRAALEIQAWRVEHGHLPESLELVEPKSGLPVLVDPWAGKPFEYFPAGIDRELPWSEDARSRPVMPPHTPFLWSRGQQYRGPHPPDTQDLERGYAFPVPPAVE